MSNLKHLTDRGEFAISFLTSQITSVYAGSGLDTDPQVLAALDELKSVIAGVKEVKAEMKVRLNAMREVRERMAIAS